MRFGVERPDEGALPITRATPAPKKLEVDVLGVKSVGVGGAEFRLSEECFGGEGGRVDE